MYYFTFLTEVNWPHQKINPLDEFGWCQDMENTRLSFQIDET